MKAPIKKEEPQQPSPEDQKRIQKEVQRHFNKFKRTMKVKSKSELVAIIWEQGMQFKKLQDIAQELYEENKILKEKTDEKTDQENG